MPAHSTGKRASCQPDEGRGPSPGRVGRGGTADESLIIGSLVRTIAGSFPEVRQIQIVCGGNPIPSLGGHLPLDRPLDVGDWP